MDAAEKLRRIVEDARGDDLERAERAFAGMSNKELNEPHGASGKTHREILEGYRQERREWAAARALVK